MLSRQKVKPDRRSICHCYSQSGLADRQGVDASQLAILMDGTAFEQFLNLELRFQTSVGISSAIAVCLRGNVFLRLSKEPISEHKIFAQEADAEIKCDLLLCFFALLQPQLFPRGTLFVHANTRAKSTHLHPFIHTAIHTSIWSSQQITGFLGLQTSRMTSAAQHSVKQAVAAQVEQESRYEKHFEMIELAAIRLGTADPSVIIFMDSLKKAVRTGDKNDYNTTEKLLNMNLNQFSIRVVNHFRQKAK